MSSPPTRRAAALADRYRIESELGAGGMATVYLAHDLKHDRKVAIKVLRPELSAVIGAGRFLREIKTIAGLQHPHILGLIDSGEMDGTAFYVMPFVEGESLRDRLTREKQLPIAEAIRIAAEVASALDYAHRRGVIHRDIKPENILLHDGQALVADFGIALAVSTAGGTRMTETGMSLGTPHYMSPEQALGEREITARADVYALGCVLYEMLVGEPPHTGPTAQAIIAKVMADEPRPPCQLRKTVPGSLDDTVLTALAKIPADRFPSAAAFGDALRAPRADSPAVTMARPGASRPAAPVRRLVGNVAWAALGAAAAAVVVWQTRLAVAGSGSPERQQVTYSGRAFAPAISPDGKFVAYIELACPEPPARGGCANLRVLEVGSARPVEIIAGANRLSSPRWTHDGLVLVVAGSLGSGRGGLFAIPRLGGTPRRLADEPIVFDTHASADSIAFLVAGDSGMRLGVMEVGTGALASVAHLVDLRPTDLAWSPDGQKFAVSAYDQIYVLARDGTPLAHNPRTVTRDNLRWSADGRHILAFRWTAGQDDDFVAFPVSDDGLLGPPRLLASLVPTLLLGQFDVARRTGRVVLGSGSEFHDLWSFDLATTPVRARRLTQGTNWYGPPFLTRDGHALYYLRADPLGNSLYRGVDGVETPLTAERQVVNNSLRLSPDESVITYESRFDSSHVLVVYDVATGGSRRVPRATDEFGWLIPGRRDIVWIAPGRGLFLTDSTGGDRRQVEVVAAEGHAQRMTDRWDNSSWFLAPDGGSVAIIGGDRDTATVLRVPLAGGVASALARFPRSDGTTGFAAWGRDGVITVARRDPQSGGTLLLRLDASSGAPRGSIVLPTACNPSGVTVSPESRRAACEVVERRADLMILDGIRP